MARFIAQFANYSHGIRNPEFMILANGKTQDLVRGLEANFERGTLTEDEVQFGLKTFKFRGLNIDTTTNEHESGRNRLSGFDSLDAQIMNGWTDEERELVEKTLRNSPYIGNAFVELVAPPAVMPWPNYPNVESPEEIVKVALSIGLDLNEVLRYEKENRNAAPVVNALEDAIAGVPQEETITVEA